MIFERQKSLLNPAQQLAYRQTEYNGRVEICRLHFTTYNPAERRDLRLAKKDWGDSSKETLPQVKFSKWYRIIGKDASSTEASISMCASTPSNAIQSSCSRPLEMRKAWRQLLYQKSRLSGIKTTTRPRRRKTRCLGAAQRHWITALARSSSRRLEIRAFELILSK